MTALLWASLKGHLPVVRELVDVYKVNVFEKDKVRVIACTHQITLHFATKNFPYIHAYTTPHSLKHSTRRHTIAATFYCI